MPDDDDRTPAWFANDVNLADVRRSAELAAENSGRPQRIHLHALGEPCGDACTTLEP